MEEVIGELEALLGVKISVKRAERDELYIVDGKAGTFFVSGSPEHTREVVELIRTGLIPVVKQLSERYEIKQASVDVSGLIVEFGNERAEGSITYAPGLYPEVWPELTVEGTILDVVGEMSFVWAVSRALSTDADETFEKAVKVIKEMDDTFGDKKIKVNVLRLSGMSGNVSIRAGNLEVVLGFVDSDEDEPPVETIKEAIRRVLDLELPDGFSVTVFYGEDYSVSARLEELGLRVYVSDVVFTVKFRRGSPVEKVLNELYKVLNVARRLGINTETLEKTIKTIENHLGDFKNGELWFASGLKWDVITFREASSPGIRIGRDGVEVQVVAGEEPPVEFFELFGGLEHEQLYATADEDGYTVVLGTLTLSVKRSDGGVLYARVTKATTGSDEELKEFVNKVEKKGYRVVVENPEFTERPTLVLKGKDFEERLVAVSFNRFTGLTASFVSGDGTRITLIHPDAGVRGFEITFSDKIYHVRPPGSSSIVIDLFWNTVKFTDDENVTVKRFPLPIMCLKTL